MWRRQYARAPTRPIAGCPHTAPYDVVDTWQSSATPAAPSLRTKVSIEPMTTPSPANQRGARKKS